MAASWGAGGGEFWRASAEETAARDSLGLSCTLATPLNIAWVV